MAERSRLALALLVALGSAGCSNLSLEIDEPVDFEACRTFELEQTGRADVLAVLGPPSEIGASPDGVVLLYETVRLEESQFGISFGFLGNILGLGWLDLLKLSLGNSAVRRSAVILLFDADAKLVAIAFARWGEDFGKGGSVQFIAAAEQVVDTGSLRLAPDPLEWGRLMLEPLPETLNLPHVARIELVGTPGGAGQRSLEQIGEHARR